VRAGRGKGAQVVSKKVKRTTDTLLDDGGDVTVGERKKGPSERGGWRDYLFRRGGEKEKRHVAGKEEKEGGRKNGRLFCRKERKKPVLSARETFLRGEEAC